MHRGALAMALLAALVLVPGCARSAPEGAVAEGERIRFRRTGGLAGETLELTIDADGSARLAIDGRERTFRVEPRAMEALHAALERGLPERAGDLDGQGPGPGGPGPLGPGRDLYEYEFTLGTTAYRTRDTQVPEALQPALALLHEMASRAEE